MQLPRIIRTPDENFDGLDGYAFAPHWQRVRVGGLELVMHYVDEGPADGEPLLFVHGVPTWAYLWRNVIPPLARAGYRCIAVDHIGCGRSDKVADDAWYSAARHQQALGQFIQALDLTGVTLVAQDWGGPIGLAQAVYMPQRFRRLVCLNTWLHHSDFAYTEAIRRWNAMWHPGGLLADEHPVGAIVLNTMGRVDQRSLIEGQPRALAGHRGQLAGYEAPFAGLDNAAFAGIRRFPLSLPFDNPVGGNAEGQALHWAALGAWAKPMHFIWGAEDPVFTAGWAEQWAARQPGATLDLIPGANHFAPDSHGARVARCMLERFSEEDAQGGQDEAVD